MGNTMSRMIDCWAVSTVLLFQALLYGAFLASCALVVRRIFFD